MGRKLITCPAEARKHLLHSYWTFTTLWQRSSLQTAKYLTKVHHVGHIAASENDH